MSIYNVEWKEVDKLSKSEKEERKEEGDDEKEMKRKKERKEKKKKKKENLIVSAIASRNNNNNNQKRNGDVVCEEQVLLDISEGGDGSLDILEMGGSKLDHRLLARLTQEAKALQGLTSCHHLHKK